MEFRILGPLDVVAEGRTPTLGGTKQRALLAYLVLRANQVVASDRLVDELWGEAPPPTALKTVQVYVSRLRKELGSERLLTRSPGYALQLADDEVDLARFEALVAQARGNEPAKAAELLREALALWRGAPLADLAYEPSTQTDIARLEELRLAALEERIAADLASGRDAELIGELEALVTDHPLRERLRGQLMLALYRAGRQADALDAYRNARAVLVDELGLEPSPDLQRLEQAILNHDTTLDRPPPTLPRAAGPILVLPRDPAGSAELLAFAAPLAAGDASREVIVAQLLPEHSSAALRDVTAELRRQRDAALAPDTPARIAAFTTGRPAADAVRLAVEQDADLLLQEIRLARDLAPDVEEVLRMCPCDVGLIARRGGPGGRSDGPVVVPFGATEHDWAALELGAWLAGAREASLRLVGALSGGVDGRDASRLLADASILVQRLTQVAIDPVLADRGPEAVLGAADGANALVVGLSDRWRAEGLGEARYAIAEAARAPVVFVRRGLRPGGLAPRETRTRFTWSLGAAG